jgi:ABC-2 type transport system permease protein
MLVTGNSPTSDAGRTRLRTAPAALQRARLFAVVRMEVHAQLREPLTTLYGLVFGLLALGYASSDAVELVSNRGSVPRTASWAIMLAFGGLTAFGQVITTMIATTAMLRDEAHGTRALIATTGLSPRLWFVGRVAAALGVMLLVYAAMPIGLMLGTVLARGPVLQAVQESLRAYGYITVPTMVVVTVWLAGAAALTQRVLGVVAAALLLVGVWQLALALVATPSTAVAGALLDPFGNAPVLAATASWTMEQRTNSQIHFGGVLLYNRLLWLGVSLGTVGLLLYSASARFFAQRAEAVLPAGDQHRSDSAFSDTSALMSLRRFTARWMQRDGGWRIVSALAVLNALANATVRPLPTGEPTVAALMLVNEHARLFLILLATVYAGELVWRERDVRVDQLVNALPVSRRDLVVGRVAGLLTGQLQIVLPLVLGALLVAVLRTGSLHVPQLLMWGAWSVLVLWLPFAQLTVLSLTVHVLLNHKVAAHLLLISGWVMAVVINTRGATPWWIRFADAGPLPTALGERMVWGTLLQRGAYWSAVSAALLLLCWWRWPSGGRARTALTSR